MWEDDGYYEDEYGNRYEDDDMTPKSLPPVTPEPPVYSFKNIDTFARIHQLGTQVEFEYESLTVKRFNGAKHDFVAWPIMVLRTRGLLADVLFFVKPGSNDALLPKEDEVCEMDIPSYGLRRATRRENPCSSWKVRHDFWEDCLVFEVTLRFFYNEEDRERIFRSFEPYFDGPQNFKKGKSMPHPRSVKSIEVRFQLRLSVSTRDAELGALDALMASRESNTAESDQQFQAFQHIMTFKYPKRQRSLFKLFPQMRDPILNPKAVPPKLVERFQKFNENQNGAYKYLLDKIPDAVCILPGGPGAGYVFSKHNQARLYYPIHDESENR